MTKTYFTISAGRTGTAWLADFLSANLRHECIHEPLGVDDFGVTMPEIRTMRTFNVYGNNDLIRAFWKRKFGIISASDLYVETNHTLAKCGLVENLANSDLAKDATLLVLRRDIVKQCVSYLVRGDFGNITLAWQWYLHPAYERRIVDPNPFLGIGQIGMALWYSYEMAARQAYYRKVYGDRLNLLEIDLERIVTPEGGQDFWRRIGGAGTSVLPPPRNENRKTAPEDLVDQIKQLTEAYRFDADKMADAALARGFSFEP